MIRIGVIGDIGSGKSFIAKLFKKPVFNADEEVKLIYRNNRVCFNNLKKKIPQFIKSFPIRKNEIVEAISNDKKNLIKISSVVHPFVRKKMKIFLKKNRKENMVILDVPLLIENKLNLYYQIWNCKVNQLMKKLSHYLYFFELLNLWTF